MQRLSVTTQVLQPINVMMRMCSVENSKTAKTFSCIIVSAGAYSNGSDFFGLSRVFWVGSDFGSKIMTRTQSVNYYGSKIIVCTLPCIARVR
jgi:hypothetical protein